MHILFTRCSQIIRSSFCLIMALCCIPFSMPLNPMGPGIPGLENLSPEEMQQLEQELQAAAQQIDAYVNSLTPEEQAEFQRAVAEVEQMMNSMEPEELNQFFEQIMAAEMEQAQMQAAQPQVQPQQPITFEQKPAPVVSKVPLTSAEEKAVTLLTSLIERTDEFLYVKTDNIPDMTARFKRWASQNKLSGTTATTTWEQQKNNIMELRQYISDLKKTDLKTGRHLFLEAFIKNNTLYAQLEQLNTQLQTEEPRIVVSSFGTQKLGESAKNALQATLNAYGTALESTKADIKKLFEEIGPELAKIKEEEKKLAEKAHAEAGKGRAITPGRTGGAHSFGNMYGRGRGGDDYDFGGGYPHGDYGTSRDGSGRKPETKEQQPSKDKDGKGKAPRGGGKDKDKEGDKDKDDKDKDKKDKTGKSTEKTDAGKEKAKEAPITCPIDGGEKLNGKYELIESNYRYIRELLEDANQHNLLDFDTRFTEEPNAELALSTLPSIERRLKRLNELVAEYTKQAKTDWKDNNSRYNEVMNKIAYLHDEQEELHAFGESLKQSFDALKDESVLNTLNSRARYVYLKDSAHDKTTIAKGDTTAPKTTETIDLTKIKTEYPESSLSSLRDIYTEWEKLNQAIPKATVPKKTETKKPEAAQSSAQKKAAAPSKTAAPILTTKPK